MTHPVWIPQKGLALTFTWSNESQCKLCGICLIKKYRKDQNNVVSTLFFCISDPQNSLMVLYLWVNFPQNKDFLETRGCGGSEELLEENISWYFHEFTRKTRNPCQFLEFQETLRHTNLADMIRRYFFVAAWWLSGTEMHNVGYHNFTRKSTVHSVISGQWSELYSLWPRHGCERYF